MHRIASLEQDVNANFQAQLKAQGELHAALDDIEAIKRITSFETMDAYTIGDIDLIYRMAARAAHSIERLLNADGRSRAR